MTEPAGPVVELYFDFSSPYSYLASTRIEQLCERAGARLHWRPILLGPIFKKIGKVPLLTRPVEGAYARVDLERWAAYLGVPLRFPPRFPVDSLAASRGYLFASRAGLGGPYCRRLLQASWAEGKDLGDREVLAELAAELGLDARALLESTLQQEVKQWLREETDLGERRGVFGAPTFFVGEERFHGNDRLFMVERALAERQARHESVAPVTPYNEWFGIRCLRRELGGAEYELEIEPHMLNRRGVAHGGAVTSLLDSALGGAVVSGLAPEEWCATLQMSVQFREPVRPGRVTGRGRLVKRGRHAAFAEGEILDPDGRVLASAQGSWYVWPRRPKA